MAKKLSNEYRLWIDGATPGTYAEIKGQQELKINRQAGNIDTSTKEDFPYGTSAPGARALTIDVGLLPNLPDALGYTRMETVSQAVPQAPVKFQIRKGGSAGATGDVVFEALMNIGNFDTDFPQNGVVKTTSQLTLAAAPTIDTLG
jgi:hypothetical protein